MFITPNQPPPPTTPSTLKMPSAEAYALLLSEEQLACSIPQSGILLQKKTLDLLGSLQDLVGILDYSVRKLRRSLPLCHLSDHDAAACGGAYQFVTSASANLREKNDFVNHSIGGAVAGALLGASSMYLATNTP